MTLELILKTLKQDLKTLFIIGSFSALGCAEGVDATSNNNHNQGGNDRTYQEAGAAGFGGNGGSAGSDGICIPNNSMTCINEDVYWQDSCGNLGELFQDCSEKQICSENGTTAECVYDCSLVTPTSSCVEQNCSFYDSFENGLCKWDINSGAPYISGAESEEKLHLEGNSLVEGKDLYTLSPGCNGDFIAQYKAELNKNAQGSLKISHRNDNPNFSGLTITHFPYGYPYNENNTIEDFD